jgi:hypothetical protein
LDVVPFLLFVVAASVLAWSLNFLLRAIDLGPELSDSAFYVLVREEYTDVESALSGFGYLVAAFAGDASSQTIRLATLAFTFAAPLALFVPAIIGVSQQGEKMFLLFAGLLAAVAGSAAYYKWLLMDPSYNSLILPLTYVAASGLWALWSAARNAKVTTAIAGGVVLGAALFAMIVVRISSGVAFLVLALPCFAVAAGWKSGLQLRQAFRTFIAASFAIVLGSLALALFVATQTLPLPILWARLLTGFETTALLSTHDTGLTALFFQLFNSIIELLGVLIREPLTLLVPLVCLGLSQTRVYRQWRYAQTLLWSVLLLAVFALVAEHISNFPDMALRAWVFALGASLIVCFSSNRETRLAFFAMLFGLAPYGLSLGTGNPIISHSAIHTGASIASLFLVALSLERGRWTMVTATVIVGAGTTISALQLAAEQPYRMIEPLSSATVRVEADGEVWRVTPPIAETYQAMSAIRETQEWQEAQQEGRPVLLDLSGRAPALNWMGDFRVPSIPWVLSGYEGSDSLLAWALAQQSNDDLRRMWIAKDLPGSEGTRRGLSLNVLNERLQEIGLQFPEDYHAVGPMVPVAYIDRNIVIFRPRH